MSSGSAIRRGAPNRGRGVASKPGEGFTVVDNSLVSMPQSSDALKSYPFFPENSGEPIEWEVMQVLHRMLVIELNI